MKNLTQGSYKFFILVVVSGSFLWVSCTKDKGREEEAVDISSLLVQDDGSFEGNYKWWVMREAGWTYYNASGGVDSIRPMKLVADHNSVQFGSRVKSISSEIFASFLLSAEEGEEIEKILPGNAAWKMTGNNVFNLYIPQTYFDVFFYYKEGGIVRNSTNNQIVNGLGDWTVSYEPILSSLLFERMESLPEGRARGTHFVLTEN